MCDPDFGGRAPLLGKVVRMEKTMGDVDGRRRTIIKLELVPFSVDEDPKSFTNVYQLQALDHLARSAANEYAIIISQQLDQGNDNSSEPSELNATVDEVTATTLRTDLEEGDPSIDSEPVSSTEGAVKSPPSSTLDQPPQKATQSPSLSVPRLDGNETLLQPACPLQQARFLAQPEWETPKSSSPGQRLRTPHIGEGGSLPPSPPFLQDLTDSWPSRQLGSLPDAREPPTSSAPTAKPSSFSLFQREMSQSRTHRPSPTMRESSSLLPSATLQQPTLSDEETLPSRGSTPPITVRDSLPQLPCQESSALSQKITLLLQYPTPPPDREEMSHRSPQQRRTPTFAEGEKSVHLSVSEGEDPSLPHFSPREGDAPDLAGRDTTPLFPIPDNGTRPPSQLRSAPVGPPTSITSGSRSQSLVALPSVEATSATTSSQHPDRSTRSSTNQKTPQECVFVPHGIEDTTLVKQTRQMKPSNKRKRRISNDGEAVEPEKRVRSKRHGAKSVKGRKESEQGLDVTLDNLAKQFSTAICLGGQVNLGSGGRAPPIHLTAPTRSHATTFQALLTEQKAHAGALTSQATIANMTYSWCLLGEAHRSTVIGSNVEYRKEARLRRCGLWVTSIVNFVYHALRTSVLDQDTGDGALDAYKIPAALAGEHFLRKMDRTEADVSQLHLDLSLMPCQLHTCTETTPHRIATK